MLGRFTVTWSIIAFFVPVNPRPGFLAEMPALYQPGGDLRDASMTWKRPAHHAVGRQQDIQSRHVDQGKRPHGEAKLDHCTIDIRRVCPVLQQPKGLLQVRDEDAIDQEPFPAVDRYGRQVPVCRDCGSRA